MKKVKMLFDDVTLLNYPLLLKLLKRYRLFSYLLPVFALLVSAYYYGSQHTYYSENVYFQNKSNSGSNAVLDEVLKGGGNSTDDEIVSNLKSWSFYEYLAEKLLVHPNFNDLVIVPLDSNRIVNVAQYFQDCMGAKDCLVRGMKPLLSQMINVEKNKEDKRIQFTITSLHSKTTDEIANVLVVLVKEMRVNHFKESLHEKINVTQKLIDSKRSELSDGSVDFLEEQRMKVTKQLDESQMKMGSLRSQLDQENMQLRSYSNRMQELSRGRKSASTNERSTDSAKYEYYKELRDRLEKLKENKLILYNEKGNAAANDSILKQIDIEIALTQTKLDELGPLEMETRSYGQYIERREEDYGQLVHDHNVLKSKIRDLESIYEKEKKMYSMYTTELVELESKIRNMSPDLAYMKKLEDKMVTLKLMESGISSDIVFESKDPDLKSFKRTNILKIAFFALVINIFVLFLYVVVRFVIDDTIYDEEEVTHLFPGLEFIGETPQFL